MESGLISLAANLFPQPEKKGKKEMVTRVLWHSELAQGFSLLQEEERMSEHKRTGKAKTWAANKYILENA
jgi:hypothetical protein